MQVGAAPSQWIPPPKIARGRPQPGQGPLDHRGKGLSDTSDSLTVWKHLLLNFWGFDEAVVSCVLHSIRQFWPFSRPSAYLV